MDESIAAKKAEEAAAAHAAHEAHVAHAAHAEADAAPTTRTYTVVKGDTLSEIGQKFGVDWREIAKVNHIANPDLIHPGQVFTIPND
ncbi:MAG: LysM peptidoglycan-binding domain-containing protein [Kineosporiaceae bacterium]|nr:LysM peptidoglycan-binding domain-containing protein [Kineosporiaceae bacterium]